MTVRTQRMRFVVELEYTEDGVEGEVASDGHRQGFTSWLELIALLEEPDIDEPT